MSEEFWKHEEELDKKFEKEFYKDLDGGICQASFRLTFDSC